MADIILGGSVGTTGTAILGRVTVEITNNTDITLTSAQYANTFITVTSDGTSTGARQVIAPLNEGSFYLVKNATTEGYPITFIGPTGTGVSIPLNIIALVNCDGTNYILPNANSSTVAPVNAGAVETSGQPVINSETLGSYLAVQQDGVGTQIDGTYGDGTLAWNVGVWTFLGNSIIRTPGLDDTLPIMRIPIYGASMYLKKPQWDKPSNRMYVPDNNGRIYVIDTTPQIDPTGTYVAGCPGVIQTIDLTSTPVTSGFSMAANIATGTIWCFNGTQAVAIPFDGLSHQTFTLTEHVEDAVYANSNIWVTTYDTSTFDQHVGSLNPSGTLNTGTFVCNPGAAPAIFNQITYDIINNVVWAMGNDSNTFGTLNMIGIEPVYPTPTVLYQWNDPTAGDAANMCIFNNGHVGLNTFNLGGGIEYSQTGSNLGYFDILGGDPWNEPSPYFLAAVYDPIAPQQYIFSANNVSGVILRSPQGGGSSVIWAYAGGLQAWVAGGGGTNTSPVGVNKASIVFVENTVATSQLIQFIGSFPVLSGNALSLTADINTNLTDVSGLTGFASGQNSEGGCTITITGAADALNNGTFPLVVDYPGETTGHYTNYTPGALPDTNNGSISWTIQYQADLDFPNTGAFGPKFLDFTQVTGLETVTSWIFSTADSPTVDIRPYLNISHLLMIGWDGYDAIDVQPISITSSGGGGGAGNSFVFQPGGKAAGNIYVDETLLANATQALNGASYTIFFDLSLVSGSYTFTTVGTWNLAAGGTWTDNGTKYTLIFGNETVLSNAPLYICGFLLIEVTQSTTVCDPVDVYVLNICDNVEIVTYGATFMSGNGYSRTIVKDNALLVNGGIVPVLNQWLYAYDSAFMGSYAVDRSSFLFVCSLDVSVDSTLFPFIQGAIGSVNATLTDKFGTATTTVNPAVGAGSIIVNAITSTIYTSNGTSWIPTGASNPTIVFQPGGTATGNIYVDEPSLATATQAFNGAAYNIFFDLSVSGSPYTFTTTSAYLDLAPGGIWTDNGLGYELIFANDTILTNVPAEITGNLFISVTQSTDVCSPSINTTTTFSGTCVISCIGAAFLNAGADQVAYLKDNASLYNDSGTFALIDFQVFVYDAATVENAAIDSSSRLYVYSLGASIGETLYGQITVGGSNTLTLTDTYGNATTTISPSIATGSIIVDGSDATVYVSSGTAWVAAGGGGGGSPYGTFGSQGYPGLDATVPTDKITIYQDGDNQTYLSEGASYSGSGPGTGLIAVSDGTNPTPTALTTGSYAFQGRPYSRSDRIVTQVVAANTGGAATKLIYTGPPPNSDGGAGATLLTVMITGVASFEQPSYGSWGFMFDTSNNSGGTITTTSLYTYNPNSLTNPVFTVDSSGNVSVTFATDYYNWTVVAISATMVIAGSL